MVAVAVGLWSTSCAGGAMPAAAPTDFQRDLGALSREIEIEGHSQGQGQRGAARGAIEHAVLLQRRWALTGDPDDLVAASALLAQARAAGASSPALWLMSAMTALDGHRLAEARQLLTGVAGDPDLADAPAVVLVGGDLALQAGELGAAAAAYGRVLDARRDGDALARLAHLRWVEGDGEGADQLYAEAEDRLDAKQMRTFAWLEVQRGRIDFARGRFAQARAHDQRAGRAYSGYWLVEARLAEVMAAMGEIPEAIAAYQTLAARTANPEIAQALGELLTFAGQPDRARPFHDRALATYQRSVDRGEVHYLHHLAAFHADISGDAEQAVRWALQDLALRPGAAATHDQMAWALFRAGRIPEASREAATALRAVPATQDPHLLYHAAVIATAAGRPDQAKDLLQRIAAINPAYQTTFHAHN